MIYGITLIFLSIIAVPSLILSKKPNAQELLDKVAPYQAWIGLVFFIVGIWGIISTLLNIGWLSTAPIWWVTLLAGSVVEATLGFMLGFSMINKLILSNNAAAQQKAVAIRGKLAPILGQFGIFGLLVGSWMIVASLLFSI
ncbi:hypothetical protein [Winogradskyella rapida]|uniref:Uncharacterized protein n=1 Tax=Winogradskyella rapida TaxID=549701 RepID=A0ABW3KQN3_9FLAO